MYRDQLFTALDNQLVTQIDLSAPSNLAYVLGVYHGMANVVRDQISHMNNPNTHNCLSYAIESNNVEIVSLILSNDRTKISEDDLNTLTRSESKEMIMLVLGDPRTPPVVREMGVMKHELLLDSINSDYDIVDTFLLHPNFQLEPIR